MNREENAMEVDDVRMSLSDWEALRKSNPKKWLELYNQFFYCNKVVFCCECPNNRDMDGNGRFPCGQYRCLADVCRK